VGEGPEPRAQKSMWDRFGLPVATGVAASLIVATVVAVVGFLTRSPGPLHVNIEIILDTSAAMEKKFGGSTRFRAAIAEMLDFVEPRDADNLALWTSGGSCGDEGAEEVVPFGQRNSDEIQAALRGLRPQGPANIGDAVVEATGTFSDPERFPAGVQKNVILLTAGRDTCEGDYVGTIEDRLREVGEDLSVTFNFFALDVPERLKRQLRGLKQRLPNQVAIDFSETPADLEGDLDDFEQSRLPIPPETSSPIPGPTAS
jgi:VWA domain-containing protein